MISIETDHNVYILGAGFSFDRGIPLMSTFMDRMRDSLHWLQDSNRSIEAEAVQRILEFRLRASSAGYRVKLDLDNVEELFSLISASRDDLSNDIRLAIGATIAYSMHSTKEPQMRFSINSPRTLPKGWKAEGPSSEWHAVPAYQFYVAALTNMLGDIRATTSKDTFLTFNYDTLLEDSLKGIGQDFNYGFDPDQGIWFDCKPMNDRHSLEVLKLHGSLNWAIDTNDDVKVPFVFESYDALLQGGKVPSIVPPTWQKSRSDSLFSVWDRALENIRSATRLVIIGFSMPTTDLHFKYLIAAGLQENVSLREVVFVNPSISDIQPRIKSLFSDVLESTGRLRLVQKNVNSFISQATVDGALWGINRRFGAEFQQMWITKP